MGLLARTVDRKNKDVYAVRKSAPSTKSNNIHVKSNDDDAKKRIFREAETAVLVPGGDGSKAEFWDYLDNKIIKTSSGKIGILNIADYYNDLIEELKTKGHESLIDTKIFIDNTASALMSRLFPSE